METQSYDVVIVGGGAAGLSAALVLGRARRRVAVIDAGAPRNAPAAHMQGYLSRDGMPPADLLAIGKTEVAGYGVEIIEDVVRRIDPGSPSTSATAEHWMLAGSSSPPDSAMSSLTYPASRNDGDRTSCTARTATAGRCATNPLACSAPTPARSSTPS